MADKYFAVPQGKVYIASRDATGQTSGFTYIGDTDGFNISTAQTFVDISVLNIDGANLARAFYGDSTVVTGATVSGEAITAYNGGMSPLRYPGVSAVTLTKGATPLVAGTDYTLDAVNGTFTILAGSTVVPAGAPAAITASYTHNGVASRNRLLTQGLKDYTLRFEGKSKFDDLVQIATVHRIAMDMAATMSLIGTGVNKLMVKGKLLPATEQPVGESQYFTYVQK
jgi:hypothetical protein